MNQSKLFREIVELMKDNWNFHGWKAELFLNELNVYHIINLGWREGAD